MTEKITIATTYEEMTLVWKLTHDAYVTAGYAYSNSYGTLHHYPHLDGICETTVFTDIEDDQLLGTITLTEDGPAGLSVDPEFKDLIDPFRKLNVKIASVWRLVTLFGINRPRVVMSLIGRVVEECAERKICLVFLVVNPKHEKFYNRMLCFETISETRNELAVKGNPGLLLMTNTDKLQPCWDEWKKRIKKHEKH
jgi:hypothetical protein